VRPGEPVSHNDASVLLRAIQRKLGVRLTMRTVPAGRHVDPRRADQVKAAQMVAAEILASVQRCEALERATPGGRS
jgi:hypothetical protein